MRAFEVSARNCSFAIAADELGVTPSAVGHQIKLLEKNLGVLLFNRQARGLVLTATGKKYAMLLGDGFSVLHRATETIRREISDRSITVSATPAVALRWLAPVLDRLRQEGFAEFRIDASSREADLAAGEADLDIRYGRKVEPGLISHVLFSESVFPVCHPNYAARLSIETPADLLGADLLFVDDWARRGGVWSAWLDWFEAAGIDRLDLSEAARFTEMDKAVEAAAKGAGVAMGAGRHLERFRETKEANGPTLVRAIATGPELLYSTTLVALPESAEEPTMRRLIRRLTAIAKEGPGVLHTGAF